MSIMFFTIAGIALISDHPVVCVFALILMACCDS
jgi:hypothetical protein